ncbi:MAG TPA: hypothetical protein VHB27_13505 [Rhodopila sp.]|uniref:hypothetical protein n=1 Tax=Rhodopila sp. TaxID=2480087 RepID=UPI002C47B434|nr:hypothetical protein [Rhodopila sp.]HVY16236.1 hypothetical protein [Rhodopila sp.]
MARSSSIMVLVLLTLTAAPAVARDTGDRANGNDYQPTPSEVRPAERQAGVTPTQAQEQKENREVEAIDRRLLRQEGMGTKSLPDFTQNPSVP